MISTLLTTLLIIDSLVLIVLIILLQQGNEGGLGGAFGGGNTSGFFGASGGMNVIVRTTWICGFLFFALALGLSWVRTNSKYHLKNQLEKELAAPQPTQTMPINPKPATAPPSSALPVQPSAVPVTPKPPATPGSATPATGNKPASPIQQKTPN